MKTIILSVVVMIMAFSSSGQRLPNSQPVETDYWAKSKRQKTAAWLMLGGGAALGFAGYVLFVYEGLQGDGVYSPAGRAYLAMWYAGGATMVASIPVFIAAARNKGIAMRGSMGIKFERGPALAPPLSLSHSYPAIAFKINLK